MKEDGEGTEQGQRGMEEESSTAYQRMSRHVAALRYIFPIRKVKFIFESNVYLHKTLKIKLPLKILAIFKLQSGDCKNSARIRRRYDFAMFISQPIANQLLVAHNKLSQ